MSLSVFNPSLCCLSPIHLVLSCLSEFHPNGTLYLKPNYGYKLRVAVIVSVTINCFMLVFVLMCHVYCTSAAMLFIFFPFYQCCIMIPRKGNNS